MSDSDDTLSDDTLSDDTLSNVNDDDSAYISNSQSSTIVISSQSSDYNSTQSSTVNISSQSSIDVIETQNHYHRSYNTDGDSESYLCVSEGCEDYVGPHPSSQSSEFSNVSR